MQLASQQIGSLDDLSFVKGEAGLMQPMRVKMDYSNMLVPGCSGNGGMEWKRIESNSNPTCYVRPAAFRIRIIQRERDAYHVRTWSTARSAGAGCWAG